jgi:hypothetical protein
MKRMRAFWSALAAAIPATAAFGTMPGGSLTDEAIPVDVELVLAVDVSLSMMREELEVQRRGYVEALRDPTVIEAMLGGLHGRVAIAFMEWSGEKEQLTVIDWRVIASQADARAFAAALEAAPVSRSFRTSISSAIDRAVAKIDGNGIAGSTRVIDISGDGANNDGAGVADARDRAVAAGIVINGLPIVARVGLAGNVEVGAMDAYYANCVIGGPGAFSIPVQDWREFSWAVRRKLALELSGTHPPAPIVLPAAMSGEPARNPVDCLAGEKLWLLQNGKL